MNAPAPHLHGRHAAHGSIQLGSIIQQWTTHLKVFWTRRRRRRRRGPGWRWRCLSIGFFLFFFSFSWKLCAHIITHSTAVAMVAVVLGAVKSAASSSALLCLCVCAHCIDRLWSKEKKREKNHRREQERVCVWEQGKSLLSTLLNVFSSFVYCFFFQCWVYYPDHRNCVCVDHPADPFLHLLRVEIDEISATILTTKE